MIRKHKFEMFRTIRDNFRFPNERLIIFHLGSKILKLDHIYKSLFTNYRNFRQKNSNNVLKRHRIIR